MSRNIGKIASIGLFFLLIDGYLNAAPTPSPTTPKDLVITVNSMAVSSRIGGAYHEVFDSTVPVDVIKDNGQSSASFASNDINREEYKVIRLILRRTGDYTGTDPCDGTTQLPLPGEDMDNILLPGGSGSDITINYAEPHPVTGLPAGFVRIQHFTVSSDPINFRLVFKASNGVICASDDPPIDTIIGDQTLLDGPKGIGLLKDPTDPNNDEIIVTNSINSTMGIFKRNRVNSTGDTPKLPVSGLDTPLGLYVDTTNNEIGVVNNGAVTGNASVTIYSLNYDTANLWNVVSTPIRTITGTNTGLSNPGGIYLDSTNIPNEILVGNGLNNSVTFYDRTIPGNVAPIRTLIGSNTGLSSPCGFYVDGTNNEIAVTNNVKSSVTFYDRTAVLANFVGQLIGGPVSGAGTTVGSSDSLTVQINHDTPQTISFTASTNGTEIASQIQTQVRKLVSGNSNVPQSAYDNFTASFDINTNQYTLISGAPGVTGFESSVVVTNGTTGTKADDFMLSSTTNPSVTGVSDTAPLQTLAGSNTGLSNPCGIYLDTTNNEIGVANSGNNTITIYKLVDITASTDGNVAPRRTIRGSDTGLSNPVGIYLDSPRDEIGVADSGNNSITFNKRDGTGVQMKELPVLVNPSDQQQLLIQYYYTGTVNPSTGVVDDPTNVTSDGYAFNWKITDPQLRQPGDASSASVVPPQLVQFVGADGLTYSSLSLGCAVLTNFLIDDLTTNCPPTPLINQPFPVPAGSYLIPAKLFGQTVVTKINLEATPLDPAQFPRPIPSLANLNQGQIGWQYWDDNAKVYLTNIPPPPLIFSQQIQISLKKNIDQYLFGPPPGQPCYTQVAGNAQTLVYSSSSMAPDITSRSDVKNNGCAIQLTDIDTFTFTVTDALGTKYIYRWKPE